MNFWLTHNSDNVQVVLLHLVWTSDGFLESVGIMLECACISDN
jgi:hypothetical protein